MTSLEEKKARLAAAREKLVEQIKGEPWYEDFGEGVVASGMDTYYGVKDLVTDLDDEDRARLKDWKDDAGESGYGTAGQVVGEIGQLLAPAGVALKGARGASAALKLAKTSKRARALALAAESAAIGGGEATQLPEEGETRLANGVWGGATALGGGAAFGVGKKALKGLTKTKAGKKLIDEGVRLTPGMAAKTMAAGGLEGIGGYIPVLGRSIQKLRDRATDDYSKAVMNKVSKKMGFAQKDMSDNSMKNLRTLIQGGYRKAWGSAKPITSDTIAKIKGVLDKNSANLAGKEKRALKAVMADMVDVVASGKQTPEALSALDKGLNALNAGKKKHVFRKVLKEAQNVFRKEAGVETSKRLKYMDDVYPEYLTIRNARRKAVASPGGDAKPASIPDKLMSAANKVGAKGEKLAFGEAPLQGMAQAGRDTLNKGTIDLLPQVKVALGQRTPSFGLEHVMAPTGRALMGDTAVQKAGRRYINPVADALRKKGLSPASVTHAYTDNKE